MNPTGFSIQKIVRFSVLALLISGIWVAALWLANYVANNDMAQNLVSHFGYIGILVIALIAGLNILLPVPAAAFVPVFTAAGLWLPLIIVILVLGTTIADLIGYWIGRWSKVLVAEHYPHSYQRLQILDKHHHHLVLPLVFLYAAFIPFPNEALLIPLAVIGFRFNAFIIPLVLGNTVNQTALALGVTNIFTLLFGL